MRIQRKAGETEADHCRSYDVLTLVVDALCVRYVHAESKTGPGEIQKEVRALFVWKLIKVLATRFHSPLPAICLDLGSTTEEDSFARIYALLFKNFAVIE